MKAATAVRIRELAATGMSERDVAVEAQVQPRTVRALLERAVRARERVLMDRQVGWAPKCMDAADWTHWQAMNPFAAGADAYAARPCTDCPAGFAAEMRSEDRCNGTPGWRPPVDDHEEAQVGETVTVSNVTVSAPCGSCSHAAVCSIKASLRGLDEADVAIPKPDPALTLGLAITVECSYYARAKNAGGAKGRTLNLTPEERERRANQGRANLAARAPAEIAS